MDSIKRINPLKYLEEGKELFRIFDDLKDRRTLGGSAFLELQYCRMKPDTPVETIVSVSAVEHGKNDSLYVSLDDLDEFLQQYHTVFHCGIYNNLNIGPVDICGINYYSPRSVDEMVDALIKAKPMEYECLLTWLYKAKIWNGFYILGI